MINKFRTPVPIEHVPDVDKVGSGFHTPVPVEQIPDSAYFSPTPVDVAFIPDAPFVNVPEIK